MDYEKVKSSVFRDFLQWHSDNKGDLEMISSPLIYRTDYYNKDGKKVCYQHAHRTISCFIKKELYELFIKDEKGGA